MGTGAVLGLVILVLAGTLWFCMWKIGQMWGQAVDGWRRDRQYAADLEQILFDNRLLPPNGFWRFMCLPDRNPKEEE